VCLCVCAGSDGLTHTTQVASSESAQCAGSWQLPSTLSGAGNVSLSYMALPATGLAPRNGPASVSTQCRGAGTAESQEHAPLLPLLGAGSPCSVSCRAEGTKTGCPGYDLIRAQLENAGLPAAGGALMFACTKTG
jgi:hypothetical protein